MISASSLALVAANFLVMLLWMVITYGSVEVLRTGRSRGPISTLQPWVGFFVTLVYFYSAIFPLVPYEPAHATTRHLYLYLGNDIAGFCAVAVFNHMSWYFQPNTKPPSRRWLAVNYGVLGAIMVPAFAMPVPKFEGPVGFLAYGVLTWSYLFVVLGLSFRRVARRSSETGWRPGAFGPATRPDVIILRVGLVLLLLALGVFIFGAWASYQAILGWTLVLFGAIVGIPFAVRNLGGVLRDTLVTLGMVGLVLSWVGGSWWIVTANAAPDIRGALFVLLVATGLAVAFLFVQPALWRLLDRTIFGRSHDQQAALQRALHRLSPELGVTACTERALSDLVAVLQVRGAALFLRDGGEIVEGRFDIDALAQVWPRGKAADQLLTRTLIGGELGELPGSLVKARIDAGVVAVVEVSGSNRLWGHLLLTTDLVGASLREEDLRAIEAFADQLGLLLDGASLLARAVDVERTLAHSEKLAVIGELTARVAHEIRNPATAARSLAQQLAREGGPHEEELGIILAELERIERQVADLLQFGRRDQIESSSIDFGALARSTADDLRPSLRASGVELEVSAESDVHGTGDPERLRQVLINLIENARDALTHSKTGRHVSITVGGRNGHIAVEVTDDGPGVDDETLARLFEPFFSSKHEGTGLGLAIVQRTIEAHGGRIEARRRPAGGMRFRIDLPRVDSTDSSTTRENHEASHSGRR